MIKECNHLNYIDRLKYLNLPTLKYRRIRGDLIFWFKKFLYFDNVAYYPDTYEQLDDRTRGHNTKLRLLKFNTNLRKYFVTYRIVKIWNNLPHELVNQECVIGFERGLDEYWKHAEFKFDWRYDPP